MTKKKKTKLTADTLPSGEITDGFFKRHKAAIYYVIIGVLAGILWLVAMRFFFVKVPETHYHANFSVYIDGVREQFEGFAYYEEIAACSSDYADNPKGRTHMHNQVNDVIHVHDQRVTYGNFFQNIGWNVGAGYFASNNGTVYQTGNGKVVKFILNGEEENNIMNRVIGSTDRLLVSYGDENTNFNNQFETVAKTAAEVNGKQDPASCSGLNGAQHASFKERLKRATFWP